MRTGRQHRLLQEAPVTPPADGDDLLLIDPDTDRRDAIDEPQESDDLEAERRQEPEEKQERANKPENLQDVPGLVCWADKLSEEEEQQPEHHEAGIKSSADRPRASCPS